jgi:hypothetical protein
MCHLQGTSLECFIEPKTEITPQGMIQMAPLIPPQGLQIMSTDIENLGQPGVVILPDMCKQSGDGWECQAPKTGQLITIRPAQKK